MGNAKRHLNYANAMATLALVIAVAGGTTAIAVSKSAKSPDVNKKGNIRAGRVTATKLADQNVTASKLAGIDIVEQSSTSQQVTAVCHAGEQLLSGGGAGALITSAPSGSNGWTVLSSSGPVTAFAVCLKANAGP